MWSAMGLSLLLHGLLLAALLAQGLPSVPGAARGGSGVIPIQLISGDDDPGSAQAGGAAPAAAADPPPAPAPAPARAAVAAPRTLRRTPAPPAAPVPVAAPSPPASVAAAPAGSGDDSLPGPERAAAEAAPGGGARAGAGGEGSIGPLDQVARPASPIRPRYPLRARASGDEADVMVAAWVDALGKVSEVAVADSAGADFDRAALAAVRAARFHPARRGGRAVPSQVALRLHFRLER